MKLTVIIFCLLVLGLTFHAQAELNARRQAVD